MKENISKILKKRWNFPGSEIFMKIKSSFSVTEKAIFYGLSILLIMSSLLLLNKANDKFLVEVPAPGGTLTEGMVGFPRFVNPLLAVSNTDKDLVTLVYSGLVKATPSGEIVPDLAESFSISEDGLEYYFKIKEDARFHDGNPITSDDVEFTITRAQDPLLKSPKRPNLENVKVEKINDKEIKIRIAKPYGPFIENLTLGILPKHIWNNIDNEQFSLSQYNVEPIGSGPYKISKMEIMKKNMLMIPTYYELTSFSKYTLGKPMISTIILRFYSDTTSLIDAYENGKIESISGVNADKIDGILNEKDISIETFFLPRIFAIFFNQNENAILSNKEVRQALDIIVDKQKIVDEVLGGYGTIANSPIPRGLFAIDTLQEQASKHERFEKASSTLVKAGWKYNTESKIWEKKDKKTTISIKVSISTANNEELVKVAEYVKADWQEFGVQTEILSFEDGDLRQNVIRPRKYEALLFGEIIGRDMDFLGFWHSGQRNDPGYNVAMYTNSKVDKILEDARKISDSTERIEKYKLFEQEIIKDVPAVFLYSPNLTYIIPNKVKGFESGFITISNERFLGIQNWFIETDKVWKIFI